MGSDIIIMAEKGFSTVFPTKNTNLDNHPQIRKPLWKYGVPWRSPSTHGMQRNPRLGGRLRRVRDLVRFYPHHPSSEVTWLNVKGTSSAPNFSLRERESHAPSGVRDNPQRSPFLAPVRILRSQKYPEGLISKSRT